MHLPGRGDFPDPDDHIVAPPTRWEIVEGRLVYQASAEHPHATANVRIDSLLHEVVHPDYEVATDLLTRVAKTSNFASDVCVLRRGIDPETDARHLEELAVEIVDAQSLKRVSQRARLWARRGVRRIFAVVLKKDQVREWSRELDEFVVLDPDASIDDPVLARPIPARALLDDAVAKRIHDEPRIAAREQGLREGREDGLREGREDGLREGLVQAIVGVAEMLGEPCDRAELDALDLPGLRAHFDRLCGR